MDDKEKIRNFIRRKYSKIALGKTSPGCCGQSCCCGSAPSGSSGMSVAMGYTREDLSGMASEANLGLGCGNPVAEANLKKGETVLDLGCGGGFDCFLACEKVGDSGRVIGVDMTPDMISLARRNAGKSGYANLEFQLGEIEHLPAADESADVIISNCVINLSLDKKQVFKEAFRVLKPGGRLCVSDIVATAELPEEVKRDLSMIVGCVAGAEKKENIQAMLADSGFRDIKMTPMEHSADAICSWAPGRHVEDYVASFMIRAVK